MDIDKFVVLATFTKADLGQVPTPLENLFQVLYGNIFNHHFISIFNPEAIESQTGQGSYMKLCTTQKLKTFFHWYDQTTRGLSVNEYDTADNFLCGDIKTAVEAYTPLRAAGGALYVVVESRLTGTDFNRAFFPCSANTVAKGACSAPYDFHNIDANAALKTQWDKLNTMQTLPSGAPQVQGVQPTPPSERQQHGLVDHEGAIVSPNVGRHKEVLPPSLRKGGQRQKAIVPPSLR